jgi:hypothetical protein
METHYEWLLQYVEDSVGWTVKEFKTELQALNNLAEQMILFPRKKWRVIKKTISYELVLQTPKGRTVYTNVNEARRHLVKDLDIYPPEEE